MAPRRSIRELARSPVPLLVVLLATLVVGLGRAMSSSAAPEEQQSVERAEALLADPDAGERVRRIGFAHDHLLAAALAVSGDAVDPLRACRVLHFVLFLLILLAVFALATEVFDARAGLAATLLLSTSALFVDEVVRVRPEVPQALLGLIAVWAFLRSGRHHRTWHLILGSLAAGMAFLFLEHALFLLLAVGVAALLRLAFRRMTLRDLGLGATVLALMLFPVLGWRLDLGGGPEPGAGPLEWLSLNVRLGVLLWLFFCVGLLLYLERERELELGVIVLSVLAAVWTTQSPGDAVLVLPLVAVIAGRGLVRAFEGRRHLAHLLLIAASVPGIWHLATAPCAELVPQIAQSVDPGR